MEPEEAAGENAGAEEDEPASAVGEDGGEVWVSPFFSEECEDRDSRLPIGVVPGLLLNVSPGGRRGNKSHHNILTDSGASSVFLVGLNRLVSFFPLQ